MPLDTLIVGLGRMGQGERGRPLGLWNHATALSVHPEFRLIGGVDPDFGARSRFMDAYGGHTWPRLPSYEPDVYVISAPTAAHKDVFFDVLEREPKAILCEKPLATTVEDAEAMVQAAEDADVPLLVNYMRRFNPSTDYLADRLHRRKIYKAVSCYSNGWAENASHHVDLFSYLLPEQYSGMQILAGEGQDLDVRLDFGETSAYVLSVPDGTLEPEFVTDRGVFQYESSWDYQPRVLDALERHLRLGEILVSNGRTALETLRICKTVESCLVS